jgi:hypothetical protein
MDKGITTCVIGTPDISMGEIYYRAKDLIKYQSPKCFVLETDCMFAEANYFDENGNLIEPEEEEETNDYGISAIQDKLTEVENDITVAVDSKYPLMKYNYRWKQLTREELKHVTRNVKFTAKGFMTSSTVKGFKYGDTYMGVQDGKTEEYDTNVLKYFDKLIELCNENDIELSLVSVPAGCSWNWHKHNTVEQLAEEKGLTFVDFNAQTDLIPTFDWTTDTKDYGLHLNNSGARKVTKAYESVLTDNLGLTATQLSDEEKAKWDEDAQIFCEKNFNYNFDNKKSK